MLLKWLAVVVLAATVAQGSCGCGCASPAASGDGAGEAVARPRATEAPPHPHAAPYPRPPQDLRIVYGCFQGRSHCMQFLEVGWGQAGLAALGAPGGGGAAADGCSAASPDAACPRHCPPGWPQQPAPSLLHAPPGQKAARQPVGCDPGPPRAMSTAAASADARRAGMGRLTTPPPPPPPPGGSAGAGGAEAARLLHHLHL